MYLQFFKLKMFELSKHRQIQILGQKLEIFCSLFLREVWIDSKEGFLAYKKHFL